jgi:hypothetical protein
MADIEGNRPAVDSYTAARQLSWEQETSGKP